VFHAAAQPEDLRAYSREITVTEGAVSLGTMQLHGTDTIATHKNKYGRDYDPPAPDSPAYARP